MCHGISLFGSSDSTVRHVRTCRWMRRIVRPHGVVDVGCSGTGGGSGGRGGAATRPARQRPRVPVVLGGVPRHLHRHRDRDRRLRVASGVDRLGKLLVGTAHCESTRCAVLVERAVPAIRDTTPVEMGAAGGFTRGDRVVRVGLAAPPGVTPPSSTSPTGHCEILEMAGKTTKLS